MSRAKERFLDSLETVLDTVAPALDCIKAAPGMTILAIVWAFMTSIWIMAIFWQPLAFYYLWNWLVTSHFNLKTVSFIEAWGFCIFIRVIASFWREQKAPDSENKPKKDLPETDFDRNRTD